MGDLATEIEQMQAEINMLDDALDVGGTKDEETTTKSKSIFSRVGNGDSKKDEDDNEDDDDSPKKRSRSMRSSVVEPSRRESNITREEIKKAQMGDDTTKRRASRMFKNLLGTLRTFDDKTKMESSTKRAEIEQKVEERVAADRRKILEERKLLLQKKREKERLLGLFEQKKQLAELRLEWEDNYQEQSKYIRSMTKPQIYWKPRIPDAESKDLLKKSKAKVEDILDEAKQNWDTLKVEINEEINELRERNEFNDEELNGEKEEEVVVDEAKRVPINKRLVITRKLNNDRRIVEPKNDINNDKKVEEDEEKEEKEEKKLTKKERRKEIENLRKRRHQSDSSESAVEPDSTPRKPSAKKDRAEERPTQDIRKVASKSDDNDEPLPKIVGRRVSLKKGKHSDDKDAKTARRTRRNSSSTRSPAKTSKRPSSSSSSSSSSESSSEGKG